VYLCGGSGMQETCEPVMTAYKLVTVDAPYWGFGYRLEQAALAGQRSLFLESHKQCIYWLDEWCDLTFDDVRQLEVATDAALNQVCCINPPPNLSKFTKSGLFASTCYPNFES
jgi:hypothetical protein